ncbi:hypothetical protein ACEUD0_19055 [Aeromonas veronii]
MRILIADDQTQRYKKLIAKITDLGILRDDIHLVSSARDASEKLEEHYYDVFILDILLPLWSEDTGDSGTYSQDILLSLYNSDEFKKPRVIIGITGDKSTVQKELASFNSHLWGVVEYSESCSMWEDLIIKSIDYIKSSVIPLDVDTNLKPSVDLVIVCALKAPELSEILKLDWNWQDPEPLNDKLFYQRGSFTSNGKTYSVVAAHCERVGMVSSTLTCTNLIYHFSPKVITMTGICAGIKGKVSLGDIIFADLVWDYQNGKRLENGQHDIDPHQVAAALCIKAHAQQLQGDSNLFKEIAINYDGVDITSRPKLHIGPIAVGSSVLEDQNIVENIKLQNRKVIGIEMETYGVYYSAINAPSPPPKVFAMKSVCDFADAEKNDNYQEYAAYTSAQALKALVERYSHNFIG